MYSLWFCQMKHQEWTLNWMPDTVCVAAAPMICSLSNLTASLHANFLFLLCYLFTPLITALHSVSRLSSYFKYSRLLHLPPHHKVPSNIHNIVLKNVLAIVVTSNEHFKERIRGTNCTRHCLRNENRTCLLQYTWLENPVKLLLWSCDEARWSKFRQLYYDSPG